MTNLMPRATGSLIPKGTQIVNFATAGLGQPLGLTSARPPQNGGGGSSTCPTCNLVAIPYDPNLPTLRM
jgi:hypothetical protein